MSWTSKADFEDIRYETTEDGNIAKITINRPEVRNAFRPLTVREMLAALYQGRLETFNSVYTYASNHHKEQLVDFDLFHQLFDSPFDQRWLSTFHVSIQKEVVEVLMFDAIKKLQPILHELV